MTFSLAGPRIVVRTVAALALLGCASTPRNPVLDKYPPGVVGRTSVFYYDIEGSTIEELRADMRRKGPKIDGTSFVGEARSPMRWSWRTEPTGGGRCVIREVTVSVNAQITLPRWTPPAGADTTLVAEWKRFIAALEEHEAGHKDISAKAGSEIARRLRDLSSLCSQLSTRANDVARTIATRTAEEQRLYDVTTRHGLTQGTSFGRGRGVASFVHSDSLTLMTGPRAGTIRAPLPVSTERAWAELPAAFTAIGLKVDAVDSTARVAGDLMTVRGTIGLLPVSDFVECPGMPAGFAADSVDVVVFVTSRLEPGASANAAEVTNTVQALARPLGTAAVACRSRGVMERRLLEALRLRLSS
jgi:predicted secreted Zn-dependent protease